MCFLRPNNSMKNIIQNYISEYNQINIKVVSLRGFMSVVYKNIKLKVNKMLINKEVIEQIMILTHNRNLCSLYK